MNSGIIIILFTLSGYSFASSCGKVYTHAVSSADMNIIVKKHNDLRAMIRNGKVPGQPKGVNIKLIKYDAKLAEAAQNIANSCEFAHKKVNDGRWSVGQNLFMISSTAESDKVDWNSAIQSWFDENKSYKFTKCCPDNEKTGHYTQVIWAHTDSVGCGYTYFQSSDPKDRFKYKKLYVCNYGPAGNIIGQFPYEVPH